MVLAGPVEDVRTHVEDVLRQRLEQRADAAAAHGPAFAQLWRLTARHVLGGKLIRPALLIDAHRALLARESADDARAVIELAASIELLHYAFLLHDDVIDGDLTRRRGPNLIGEIARSRPGHAVEKDLHWARTSAILMGDLLLSTAVLGFARAEVGPHAKSRLLDLLDQAIEQTVAGEHTDVGLSDGVIPAELATILTMTGAKTAAYSFSLPLRTAAVLTDAPAAVETALSDVGYRIGLAFQLQDDLLSLFGDPLVHGKEPFSDLREGKETAIIAFARRTDEWARIAPQFGEPDLRPDEAARACELLRACGAERFVSDIVHQQLSDAEAALARLERTGSLASGACATIRSLIARVRDRRS